MVSSIFLQCHTATELNTDSLTIYLFILRGNFSAFPRKMNFMTDPAQMAASYNNSMCSRVSTHCPVLQLYISFMHLQCYTTGFYVFHLHIYIIMKFSWYILSIGKGSTDFPVLSHAFKENAPVVLAYSSSSGPFEM